MNGAKWISAAIGLVACHDAAPAEPATVAPADTAIYVASGMDEDGPVSVAIVVQGTHVTGYACGDDPSKEDYTGWFYGDVDVDGRFVLTHDRWLLVGSTSAAHVAGTLKEPDGNAIAWSGTRAGGADLTGLYAVRDSGCETGVVVMDDGDPSTPPVVRGAWCDDAGFQLPVQPILPISLIGDRLPIEISRSLAPRRLLAARVVDRSGFLRVTDL